MATRGVGARRERTRPEAFLSLLVPMPSVCDQRASAEIFGRLAPIKRLQIETETELSRLLPAVLDRAFRGEL